MDVRMTGRARADRRAASSSAKHGLAGAETSVDCNSDRMVERDASDGGGELVEDARTRHLRLRSARSAVEESGDLRPCRKTHAGGLRRGSVFAAVSGMRKRDSACAAVPAVA